MLNIKRMSEDHWQEFRDLRLEALVSDPNAFASSYEEEVLLEPEEWKNRIQNALFAFDNKKIAGMIVIVPENKIKTSHIAVIYAVYVRKNSRGKGIGKKLVEAALSTAVKKKNIIKVKLSVNSEQTAAVSLYEKMGFEKKGLLKKDLFVNGSFYDEIIMEKLL